MGPPPGQCDNPNGSRLPDPRVLSNGKSDIQKKRDPRGVNGCRRGLLRPVRKFEKRRCCVIDWRSSHRYEHALRDSCFYDALKSACGSSMRVFIISKQWV